MKKIVFYRDIPILATVLLAGITSYLLWYNFSSNGRFSYIIFFISIVLVGIILIAISSYIIKKDDCIAEIQYSKNILTFVEYINNQKVFKNIQTENIDSCQILFSVLDAVENTQASSYDSNNTIVVEFNIYLKNGESYTPHFYMTENIPDGFRLKDIFSLAKTLPNFSYKINTNINTYIQYIQEHVMKGKNPFIFSTIIEEIKEDFKVFMRRTFISLYCLVIMLILAAIIYFYLPNASMITKSLIALTGMFISIKILYKRIN